MDRIGNTGDAVEIERNSLGQTGGCHGGMHPLDPRGAAEFPVEIGLAVDAVGRQVGIEKKRPPLNRDTGVGPQGQRMLEPALADIAPRAHRIENILDLHFSQRNVVVGRLG